MNNQTYNLKDNSNEPVKHVIPVDELPREESKI